MVAQSTYAGRRRGEAGKDRIDRDKQVVFFAALERGHTKKEAAELADIGVSTGYRWVDNRRRAREQDYREGVTNRSPIGPDASPSVAQRALEDFAYFQRVCFGRVPIPWQTLAATRMVELLESPDDEYAVVNAPPGSGKTLLFTHDIPAWLTARNRAVRGMMGAATTALAQRYVNRLRRTLARTEPEKASADNLARGIAHDAEATMSHLFGRFQPADREPWTAAYFVVRQPGDAKVSEKEPTWSGYGMDAGFIGGRYNFVVWDDLVDPRKLRTIEAKETLQGLWDDVAETRLEPGGLLILQGQRISSDDLYRYCVDKTVPLDIDPQTGEIVTSRPKYHHIVFQAHYPDKCSAGVNGGTGINGGSHRLDAEPFPDGCLLSPYRLPWRKLSAAMTNNKDRFAVIYQQEDSDPDSVLVDPAWIYGHGEYPGCLDPDRDRLELPRDETGAISLAGELFSAMSVDPSPTKMWALEWWVYQPFNEYRWLMDLLRSPMDADDFLDWNNDSQRFSGVLDEWVLASREIGVPITHVIVEQNAAQRFLLQYEHVRRWMSVRGVEIVAHNTHRNKSDPEFGVQTIAPHYRFGRVRLPYKRNSDGFNCAMNLINEVTKYPHGRTDDCVMAHWFLEWQLPHLYSESEGNGRVANMPSWAKSLPDPRGRGGPPQRGVAWMERIRVGA